MVQGFPDDPRWRAVQLLGAFSQVLCDRFANAGGITYCFTKERNVIFRFFPAYCVQDHLLEPDSTGRGSPLSEGVLAVALVGALATQAPSP